MKKALKKAWIKDLRENPQAKGKDNLCYEENGKTLWCCLGRLADIGLSFDWTQEVKTYSNGTTRTVWVTDADPEDFPHHTMNSPDVLSLSQLNKLGITDDQQMDLTELNDDYDTWEPVIKYIEENIKEE